MAKRTPLTNEIKTISAMIEIFCRQRHGGGLADLCPDCNVLLEYAKDRLARCKFADDKPACSHCPVHCYKPAKRKQVIEVMRFAGPRMLKKHPIMAIKHLANNFKKPPSS
jgi:hypothetical protein